MTNQTNNTKAATIVLGSADLYIGLPVRIVSKTSKNCGQKAEISSFKCASVTKRITSVTVKIYSGKKHRCVKFTANGSLQSAE